MADFVFTVTDDTLPYIEAGLDALYGGEDGWADKTLHQKAVHHFTRTLEPALRQQVRAQMVATAIEAEQAAREAAEAAAEAERAKRLQAEADADAVVANVLKGVE